jgi:hypothetical protein
VFLPVEVAGPALTPAPSLSLNHTVQPSDGRIEIELVNGHRLKVEGSFDGDALSRLLKGLVC